MMKHFLTRFFIILINILPAISYAGYTISPVKVQIDKDKKITTIQLTSTNNEERRFQLTVLKLQSENGKNVFKETKDLLVTPGMFKLAAGKTQTIRMATKDNVMYTEQQDIYKLNIRELPHFDQRLTEGSAVQLVTEFQLPVSITGNRVASEEAENNS